LGKRMTPPPGMVNTSWSACLPATAAGSRGHLVSQRGGNRAELGALLPGQLGRIGSGPVQQRGLR
jgi:hypothetical protein